MGQSENKNYISQEFINNLNYYDSRLEKASECCKNLISAIEEINQLSIQLLKGELEAGDKS
ncbi:hypothetical protein M2459_001388 [Parabacteroides sp. PF5-5]|uniref:hypothetical protein n=1 Tax=unclassified Parabacteroides TaxID=2649774 RepID=UPI002474D17B|nr:MULTISPECIES: hypothetical protein [unclassified Parabacteroides]MDH6304652.1 hypothetical protein [Parabacteroides sp. PH5-39]MDH6315734.1 hypothetical protein [Parabacteroides sp. PF5-13]MDH6319394.1 hypothetical protein [Parabacteroides sp. PH5-13]MDH6323125.1 hypothetical protein [Parabacteroides sp. PH5-8]MDH6326927.1 hypothetical protein [Parabacteroides sp. PH5-41]